MFSIEVKNLSLKLSGHQVLTDISELIPEGQLYYLMGTAGGGKTSFLKALNGLFMDIDGSIIVDGKNIYDFSKNEMLEYHKRCSFIFQNSALISNMTILENLSLFYNYHTNLNKKEIIEKISPYLTIFNLEMSILNERPAFLSTGQRMLFNIIRGLLEDPEIIFWDEPVANLDQIETNKVKKIIKEKKNKGITTVLVTNDWQFGVSVADKVGVLHNSKLIFSGTPENILKSSNPVIKSLILEEG